MDMVSIRQCQNVLRLEVHMVCFELLVVAFTSEERTTDRGTNVCGVFISKRKVLKGIQEESH